MGQCLSACLGHGDCGVSTVCTTAGVCLPFPSTCDAPEECGSGAYCSDGKCRKALLLGDTCSNDLMCGNAFCADGVCCSGVCDGSCTSCRREWTGADLGQCAPITVGTDPGDHCPGQLACDGSGECYAGLAGDACSTHHQCIAGECRAGECTLCGDGIVSGDEQCDDGNTTDDGNGCNAQCRTNNICGNGIW